MILLGILGLTWMATGILHTYLTHPNRPTHPEAQR